MWFKIVFKYQNTVVSRPVYYYFFNVIRAFEIKILKWFVEIECTILWYVFELKKKIIKNY